jgi:gluconolactonase
VSRRPADIFAEAAALVAMPGGYDIGSGDTAGWGRGCDGPVWAPELNALAFSDAGHSRRLTWAPGEAVLVLHEETGGALGAARDAAGRFIACEWEGRRVSRREPDGTVTVIADRFEGKALNRPDDVAIAPDDAIWFTDLRIVFPPWEPGSVAASGLYRVSPDLESIQRVETGVASPGGLAFSPDGRTLYLSDPAQKRVVALPVGGDGGAQGPARVLATLDGEAEGRPHGLCVDLAGNLYVGGPGGLWVIGPDGRARGVLELPASRVTNVAFGGADGRTLYITTTVGVGCIPALVQGFQPSASSSPRAAAPPRRPPRFEQFIERLDPALDQIIAPGAEITNLGSGGFLLDLGGGPNEMYARSLEGTVWSRQDNCLYFSDIGNSRRMRWDRSGEITVAHQPTGHTNGAVLDQDGRIISCEHSGRRLSLRERDGRVTTLLGQIDGQRLNRPNDAIVRSDGTIFFTNPWWDFGAGETGEIGYAGVYQVSPDLKTITLIAKDFIVPNGLAFSPDERILYINDTMHRHIRAFDARPDGSIDAASNRIFCDLDGEKPGRPDGMKVDQAGNLYCSGAGGMWVIDPAGKHLGTVVHGALQTNNLAFGGDDWKTLFFVSWTALYSIRVLIPGLPNPPPRR